MLPRSLPYPVISPETKRRDSGDRQRKAGKEGMSKNCCHSSGRRPTDRLLDAARRNRRGRWNAKRVTGRGGYMFHSPYCLSSASEAQELRCSEIPGSLAPSVAYIISRPQNRRAMNVAALPRILRAILTHRGEHPHAPLRRHRHVAGTLHSDHTTFEWYIIRSQWPRDQ